MFTAIARRSLNARLQGEGANRAYGTLCKVGIIEMAVFSMVAIGALYLARNNGHVSNSILISRDLCFIICVGAVLNGHGSRQVVFYTKSELSKRAAAARVQDVRGGDVSQEDKALIGQLRTQVTSQQAELETIEQELQRLRAAAQGPDQANQTLIEQLRKQVSLLKEELQQQAQDLQRELRANAVLSRGVNEDTAKNERLLEQNAEWLRRYKAVSEKKETLQSQNTELREQNTELRSHKAELLRSHFENVTQRNHLIQENIRLKEQDGTVQKKCKEEVEGLKQKHVAELSEKTQQFTLELTDFKQRLAKTSKSLDEIRSSYNLMQQQQSAQQQEWAAEKEQLRADIAAQLLTIDELRHKLLLQEQARVVVPEIAAVSRIEQRLAVRATQSAAVAPLEAAIQEVMDIPAAEESGQVEVSVSPLLALITAMNPNALQYNVDGCVLELSKLSWQQVAQHFVNTPLSKESKHTLLFDLIIPTMVWQASGVSYQIPIHATDENMLYLRGEQALHVEANQTISENTIQQCELLCGWIMQQQEPKALLLFLSSYLNDPGRVYGNNALSQEELNMTLFVDKILEEGE